MTETCIYKIINGFSNIDCTGKSCGKYRECHSLIILSKNHWYNNKNIVVDY